MAETRTPEFEKLRDDMNSVLCCPYSTAETVDGFLRLLEASGGDFEENMNNDRLSAGMPMLGNDAFETAGGLYGRLSDSEKEALKTAYRDDLCQVAKRFPGVDQKFPRVFSRAN